jgi:hypothetical protein
VVSGGQWGRAVGPAPGCCRAPAGS